MQHAQVAAQKHQPQMPKSTNEEAPQKSLPIFVNDKAYSGADVSSISGSANPMSQGAAEVSNTTLDSINSKDATNVGNSANVSKKLHASF